MSSEFEKIKSEWAAIIQNAPPDPKGHPNDAELIQLRQYKERKKEFLASIGVADRKRLTEKNRGRKKDMANEQTRKEKCNRREKKHFRNDKGYAPRKYLLKPLPHEVNMGWGETGDGVLVTHVVPFYSHSRRTLDERMEDDDVFGGIDRRVFSNLFEEKKHKLMVPALALDGYQNLMKHGFLSSAEATSSEHFYQAAKCEEECDARFIITHLSSYLAARYGQGRMLLTDEMKGQLVALGADSDDFEPVAKKLSGKRWNLASGGTETRWRRRKGSLYPRKRPEWESIKTKVMLHILRQKFIQCCHEGSAVHETMAAIIRNYSSSMCFYFAEHTGNDFVWGDGRNGKGANFLGKTLSHVMLEACGRIAPGASSSTENEHLIRPSNETVEYIWPSNVTTNSEGETVDYLLVLDFEATCDNNRKVHPQEIIEFPTLLLNTRTREVDDEFHFYVKPDVNEVLTEFCTELTGITQDMLSLHGGLSIREVIARHIKWLENTGLKRPEGAEQKAMSFIYLTCGDWDLKTCLPNQLMYHGESVPEPMRHWINMKKEYANLYQGRWPKGMKSMLDELGLTLEGRHHSGIDDCRNIARICVRMLEDGWTPKLPSRKSMN